MLRDHTLAAGQWTILWSTQLYGAARLFKMFQELPQQNSGIKAEKAISVGSYGSS